MQSHAVKGHRLVRVEWWYELDSAQGSSAKHYDHVKESELGMFCRQLISVADATDRTIHIHIGN